LRRLRASDEAAGADEGARQRQAARGAFLQELLVAALTEP
jgi:hypothetical protein